MQNVKDEEDKCDDTQKMKDEEEYYGIHKMKDEGECDDTQKMTDERESIVTHIR